MKKMFMLLKDNVYKNGPYYPAGKIVECELLDGECVKHQFGPNEHDCLIFTDTRNSLRFVDEEYTMLEEAIKENNTTEIVFAAKTLMQKIRKSVPDLDSVKRERETGLERFDEIS